MEISLASVQTIMKNPTWDVLAVVFFIAAGFIYGMFAGKSRLISVLIGTYISSFIFSNLYFLNSFTKEGDPSTIFFVRLSVFFILLISISLLVSRLLDGRTYENKVWWHVFTLAFLEIGFLMSLAFKFLPARDVLEFSPLIQNFFAGDTALFWWMSLPLLALWIISR